MVRAVYQGADSCMAKREGWYVRRIEHPGVDTVAEAVALAYAVLKDWRRGYSYDSDGCRKIRVSWKLTERRLRYIYTLAVKHGASERELRVIKRLILFVLKRKRLPKRVQGRDVRSIVRRMIARG